jgi:two-component system chemotaxis response regulator CheY
MATILTVDDSSTMRKMVSLTATQKGHTTVEADSGESALELLQTENVDLIILDINMGGMSGIETLKRIKDDPKFVSTPVMMLTTESADGIKQLAKQYGAKGWITKPFKQEQLTGVFNAIL